MSNVNLGKVIDMIVSKVKGEEEQPAEKPAPETPAAQAPEQAPSTAPPQPKTVYIKTWTLNSLDELERVKGELETGNIAIVRLTPLLDVDLDDVKRAVRKLKKVTAELGGDIASIDEDRIIVTPPHVKIWRKKTPSTK